MKAWSAAKLEPVVREWYPKIVKMLPSEGYHAPRKFTIQFKIDDKPGAAPAYAGGNRVTVNLHWAEREKDREAVGAVVHEMVHVVQQYKFGSRRSPFWLQEGIPDYIRWYLYEPEKNGARIRDASKANYDKAYRVSANFLNYVTNKYDKDLVQKVNAAVRQGRYSDELFKTLTGKTLEELNDEWKKQLPG
ncbi:MAG: basic secretory protein-like protein [Tepidisphaeraceae bacterium]